MLSNSSLFKRVKAPYINHETRYRVATAPSTSLSTSIVLTPQYDSNSGTVTWVIDNPTPYVQYVVIYRGAIIEGTQIGPYPFGNAFWVDYMGSIQGQTVSTPITSLSNIPEYSIGMINNHIPAFVFLLQPKTKLSVPEGGFNGLQQLFYTPISVTPDKLRSYIIFWSILQYTLYVMQTQYNTRPVAFPYIGSMYNFNTQYKIDPAFNDLVLRNPFS